MKANQTAWIFTYYDNNDLSAVLKRIQPGDSIIAVDSGLDLLLKYRIMPRMVIGDFDSLSPQSKALLRHCPDLQASEISESDYDSLSNREIYRSVNCPDDHHLEEQLNIIQARPEKDETDTELAVEWCLQNQFTTINLINSMQNRFDHCTGIISILENAFDKGVQIKVISAGQEIFFSQKEQPLDYNTGLTFSLCPVSDTVKGVKTENCVYPLNEETLYRTKTRGISNIIHSENAGICFESGKLLVIIQLGAEPESLSEAVPLSYNHSAESGDINA